MRHLPGGSPRSGPAAPRKFQHCDDERRRFVLRLEWKAIISNVHCVVSTSKVRSGRSTQWIVCARCFAANSAQAGASLSIYAKLLSTAFTVSIAHRIGLMTLIRAARLHKLDQFSVSGAASPP